ncbi:MAG TPA: hypothetical protein VKF80_04080 [Candidatus Eisenbacteria bacterium]|nr:hypothetical protein [Candidatus Eisenbacteria bacterium]
MMQSISNFLSAFWHQTQSVAGDIGDYLVDVFDKNSGPWPKITVGGAFVLIVLFVVMKTSKPK